MLGQSGIALQQINRFYGEKVRLRRLEVQKAIETVAEPIQDILKGVETLEPRFISTFSKINERYEGLHVLSPTKFEVVIYLNQMGVFNFVDDGSIPGHAVLKLSDGRKRSMSLWVEFITASGYLSARKIRNRFHALVAETLDKTKTPKEKCRLLENTSDVRLLLYAEYIVQLTCAFRCNGIWPRSVNHWPSSVWPNQELVKEVQVEGFDLLSKEVFPSTSSLSQQSQSNNGKSIPSAGYNGGNQGAITTTSSAAIASITPSMMEGDAWAISMENAERILFTQPPCRQKVLNILKTLRDKHLDYPDTATSNYLLKTLVLWECEKHPSDLEWQDICLGDRIIGILIQLISCLQCRRCPHYFLPQMDLLKGKSIKSLEESARSAWIILRQLLLNTKALDNL